MKAGKPGRAFDPHETAREMALAGLPLASFQRRASAFLIDLILVFASYGPAMLLLRLLLVDRLHLEEDLYSSAHVHVRFDFHALTEVAWTIWLVLYFGLFVWATNGFTPGKRLLRIRVLSLEHARITLWQAVERALGYGASFLELGFGFFQYFLQPNHRCVHDRIAETIVVQERQSARA
ncbi:MAG TPA: RDD family protein [Bryobacteraceae bacterium]|nr:RDD family protein [Bryobacteraceae bacterium]